MSPHKPIKSCPFCEASIEKSIIAESALCRAIYNRAPILPGHSLIVPKRHICSLMELTHEEFADFFHFAKTITQVLIKAFQADGYDWSIQEGQSAGQTVNHLHLHIIVRHTGDLDTPGAWFEALQQKKNPVLDSTKREKLHPDDIRTAILKIRAAGGTFLNPTDQ